MLRLFSPFAAIARNYRDAFSGLPRTVWLLSVASLVNRSGTMVLPFLTLFLTEKRGLTPLQAGSVLAVYGMGGVAGTYLGGWLSDRVDPRVVMAVSLVLTGGGFLVLGQLTSHAAIVVTVFFLSLVAEAFRPANSTAIGAASPPDLRTRSYALYRLAINLGMTLGPAIGGVLAAYDYAWLFWADGGTCILAAGFLWMFFRREVRAAHAAKTAASARAAAAAERSPWRDGPYMALAGLMLLLALVSFQVVSTFPLTLREVHHFNESRIGLALSINTLLIVLFEMVLIHRIGAQDPLKVVAVGTFLFCLGLGLLPYGSRFAWVAFTVAVWTVGEMMSFPMLAGITSNRAGDASRGRYMAVFTLSFESAFVVAAPAGTWILQRFGAYALWNTCTALGAVLSVGFWVLARWFRPAAPPAAPAPG